MSVEVDLQEVKDFIYSEKFSEFLTNNCTEIGTCLYILQTLFDALNADMKAEKDNI